MLNTFIDKKDSEIYISNNISDRKMDSKNDEQIPYYINEIPDNIDVKSLIENLPVNDRISNDNVIFEFIDTKQNKTIGRSPNFESVDNKLNEIDVYALVPDISLEQYEENPYENHDVDELANLLDKKRETIKPKINITPLIVSTQSAKCSMTMPISLKELALLLGKRIEENLIEGKNPDYPIRGVLYMRDNIHYGEIKVPKPGKKGQFPNNCSVLIRSPMGSGRDINIKCFFKGNITMVGCLIKEDGLAVIKILEQFIRKQKTLFQNKNDAKLFKIQNFEITMVNSGYNIGYHVDRDRLYNFLCEETKLNVSYNPISYAGVKISFYYNKDNTDNDGICKCTDSFCTGDSSKAGKGKGIGDGQCKRVTISVFESGNIINTGGRGLDQAKIAYDFINHIFRNHANKFVKIPLEDIFD
jgi:hypothetical protein